MIGNLILLENKHPLFVLQDFYNLIFLSLPNNSLFQFIEIICLLFKNFVSSKFVPGLISILTFAFHNSAILWRFLLVVFPFFKDKFVNNSVVNTIIISVKCSTFFRWLLSNSWSIQRTNTISRNIKRLWFGWDRKIKSVEVFNEKEEKLILQ